MNREESKLVISELTTMFPNINYWVRTNSPDPIGTLESWRRVVSRVSYIDAWSVLDAMACGDLPALEQYELGRIAIYIKDQAEEVKRRRNAVWRRAHDIDPEPEPACEPLPAGLITHSFRLGLQSRGKFPGIDREAERKTWVNDRLRSLGYGAAIEENA